MGCGYLEGAHVAKVVLFEGVERRGSFAAALTHRQVVEDREKRRPCQLRLFLT